MTKSKPGKQGKQKLDNRQPLPREPEQGSEQSGDAGGSRQGDASLGDEAEVQRSAQREGMGSHRHSGRGNEQAIDAAADVDDLGNRIRGAANSREAGNKG
jgi:hypothetical protein